MTSIPVGPATSILQNIIYALPGKATFLTSNDEVETSLDQLTWTAQAESVTGMITGSKFVRCTTTDSIIVCSNIVIESGGGGGSNPFNQDLNTTDSPQFVSLGVDNLTGVTNSWIDIDGGNGSLHLSGLQSPGNLTIETVSGGGGYIILAPDGITQVLSDLDVTGSVTATDFIATTNPGIDTSITTGGLVGKTITVVNGRITAFA